MPVHDQTHSTVPHLPRSAMQLGAHLSIPNLHKLISHFLYEQENPDDDTPLDDIPLDSFPVVKGRVRVFPSAISMYYAPSDKSGIRGMFRERIRAVDSWRKGPGRHDTVFLSGDPGKEGFLGLLVARVRLFMSVVHNKVTYPCALVCWFSTVGDLPCPDTGMWKVEPDFDATGGRTMSVVHLDTILRNAHLMGVAGGDYIPLDLKFHNSLDAFREFYVNKYIDHHSHEIVF
jgi:hypothetical protein